MTKDCVLTFHSHQDITKLSRLTFEIFQLWKTSTKHWVCFSLLAALLRVFLYRLTGITKSFPLSEPCEKFSTANNLSDYQRREQRDLQNFVLCGNENFNGKIELHSFSQKYNFRLPNDLQTMFILLFLPDCILYCLNFFTFSDNNKNHFPSVLNFGNLSNSQRVSVLGLQFSPLYKQQTLEKSPLLSKVVSSL